MERCPDHINEHYFVSCRKQYGTWRKSGKLYTQKKHIQVSIQLLAKLDPVMQDHISHILKDKLPDHYHRKYILNKLTELTAEKVHSKIISCAQSAKCFSIIADCTPDISHMEQLSVTIRYVDVTNNSSHKRLTDVILKFLEKNKLELECCRGQEYDNAANMKGKLSGVQKKFLDQNPLAFLSCPDA
jgi:hypothetical protein